MDIDESVEELKEQVRSRPEYIAEKYFADITEQLAAYMEKNDITKSELADKMEVSPSQVSQFFNSNSNVTLLTLAKIAKALGVSWHIRLDTLSEGVMPRGVHYDRRFFPGGRESQASAQVGRVSPNDPIQDFSASSFEEEGNKINVKPRG